MISVIRFTGAHCPNCKVFDSLWNELEEEHQEYGVVEFETIDAHSNSQYCKDMVAEYNVKSIPHVVILDGGVVDSEFPSSVLATLTGRNDLKQAVCKWVLITATQIPE